MSYYDDWVEPNAYFPTALAHMASSRARQPHINKGKPKTHLADGCGVTVRLVEKREDATCCACRSKTE